MPLYEYECSACGARFERIRKFSDPPLEVCPECGAGPVRKLVSSPAFQFKGTGFYATDYAKKTGGTHAGDSKHKDHGSSDSTSSSDSASKGSASHESSSKDSSKDSSSADSSSKDSAPKESTSAPAPPTTAKKEP